MAKKCGLGGFLKRLTKLLTLSTLPLHLMQCIKIWVVLLMKMLGDCNIISKRIAIIVTKGILTDIENGTLVI